MSYSKLFSSIVHSSLWTEEDHVRLLFVTLLAIADREGYIYGSRMGLNRLANIIAEDHDRDPWNVLMQPDADSSDLLRNPENEGRRIEEVPGGFRILNYAYYRALRNEDDRREQNREAQRRHRSKVSIGKPVSSPNKPASAKVSLGQTIPSASVSSSKNRCSKEEAEEFCKSIGLPASDGEAMFLHWQEKGWAKVKDWKLTIQKWKSFGYMPSQKAKKPWDKKTPDPGQLRLDREFDEAQKRKEERKREQTDPGGQNYGCM